MTRKRKKAKRLKTPKCEQSCMEWHSFGGWYKVVKNCKCLTVKNSRVQCKRYPKLILKKKVAGEILRPEGV